MTNNFLKVVAYYESPKHWYAEIAGIYDSEEEYMNAFPELEKKATASRMIVTESVIENEQEYLDRIK